MPEEKDKILAIASQFLETVKKAGINIITAYLYGSWAKGKANKDSDIDIAVISNEFTGNRLEDLIFLGRFCHKIDIRIEAMPFRPERFRDENPLVWEIKKNGIKIA